MGEGKRPSWGDINKKGPSGKGEGKEQLVGGKNCDWKKGKRGSNLEAARIIEASRQ